MEQEMSRKKCKQNVMLGETSFNKNYTPCFKCLPTGVFLIALMSSGTKKD